MEGLQEDLNKIEESLEALSKKINLLDNKEPSKREKAIARINSDIKELEQAISNFDYDRQELDLSNSSFFKISQEDLEKRLNALKDLFQKKQDPNYAQRQQIRQQAAASDTDNTDKLIMAGLVTQEKGTEVLENIYGQVVQTDKLADDIGVELDRQVNQLEQALITVKDTHSDIKTADEYVKYFARELVKDKLWKGLLLLMIVIVACIICFKIFGVGSGGAIPDDMLNGDD